MVAAMSATTLLPLYFTDALGVGGGDASRLTALYPLGMAASTTAAGQ